MYSHTALPSTLNLDKRCTELVDTLLNSWPMVDKWTLATIWWELLIWMKEIRNSLPKCAGSILTFNHAATSSLSSSSLKFFYLSSGLASCCQYCPHRVLAALQGGFQKRKAQHCSPQFHSSSLCNTHLLPFLVWTATNDSCSNDKRENNIMTDYK